MQTLQVASVRISFNMLESEGRQMLNKICIKFKDPSLKIIGKNCLCTVLGKWIIWLFMVISCVYFSKCILVQQNVCFSQNLYISVGSLLQHMIKFSAATHWCDLRTREYWMIYWGPSFSPSYDLAPTPSPPPLPSACYNFCSVFLCVAVAVRENGGRGLGRSQIRGRRESLV